MKKIYFAICALAFTAAAQAQTIPNAGFEAWRTSSAGSGSTSLAVKAPINWFGADSLIIADGQTLGSIAGIPPSVWQTQLYKDSGSNAHGGTYSAKMVTKHQDTLGTFPGVLSNAQAHITIAFTGTSFSVSPLTYSGGTPVTAGAKTVSAWVLYTAGAALDSGILSAGAYAHIGGIDSLVGSGSVKIAPCTSFTQVTATLNYPVIALGALVDTVRIYLASSAGGAGGIHNAVGSTLWADDVTMTMLPVGIKELDNVADFANVYPNPANDVVNIEVAGNDAVTFNLVAVNGQTVASKTCTGKTEMDISGLSAGLYFYTITNTTGATTQRGKLSIVK